MILRLQWWRFSHQLTVISPIKTEVSVAWTVDGVSQTTETTATLVEGENTITRTATDAAGNTGTASVSVTLITRSPQVEIVFPPDRFATNQLTTNVIWNVNGIEQDSATSESLVEGMNIITRSAVNASGMIGTASVNVIRDIEAPTITGLSPVNGSTIHTLRPIISGSFNDLFSGINPAAFELYINGSKVVHSIDFSEAGFNYTPPFDFEQGNYIVTVYISDRAGNKTEISLSFRILFLELPPNPADIAPQLDKTIAADMRSAVEFLYTGNNPVQRNVPENTIEPLRATVIRGKVLDRDGRPLPEVRVSVHNHPQFGYTLSRLDGMYDLVVNGGDLLTLEFEKDQFINAQRQVQTHWQEYVWAPDVILIMPDPIVTPISLVNNTTMQVALGSVVSDNDGTRQVTILFPPGTQVTNFNDDVINVRATEYTVGENGPKAMPAVLPPQVGYTYCVELSVDGVEDVHFNQPVYVYVDNFLNFPVGGIVPSGYYDRRKAVWVPSDNGRIIRIISKENGHAVLDIEGNNQPADNQSLAELGIAEEELTQLAQQYAVGQCV